MLFANEDLVRERLHSLHREAEELRVAQRLGRLRRARRRAERAAERLRQAESRL
ncbi:hypothetical protein [Thermopolyspora flexuosa]|uniref:hypothetical protein n=1 Tax=Thermopolyspora flexuosa TaxID=103836 RepID=UPI001E2EDC0A|nr:hypothetical protein [Thermopolyspora flexuosa]